jgi:IS605 OrfB family transposase
MKLTAQVKILPTSEQADALIRTLQAANAAANYVSDLAWEKKQFRQYDLHYASYFDIREKFAISAQMAVRVISKVADAYKLDKERKRVFRETGAIAYDSRILSWKLDRCMVSIWTLDGRTLIPFVCGEYHRSMLAGLRGEADLKYRNGEFYILQTCDVAEASEIISGDFLGVDLGIVNIAVDSDGVVHCGKSVGKVRHRHRSLRRKLQKKGTKSCRKRIKKLSGKEHRFATHTNHVISKRIVETAERTARGIALEDLGGIRKRVKARRGQRATLHSWSFNQLRGFIEYKAKRAGVRVIAVDPRNTSRTCPACNHIDKANRKSQSKFSCVRCNFSGFADHIAAENIRRAAVNQPYISTTQLVA